MVPQGSQGQVAVNLTRQNFTGQVNFSLEGNAPLATSPAPNKIAWSFNPNPTTGNQTTLTLQVGAQVPAGNYTLTVRGRAQGLQDRTVTLNLTVQAAAGAGPSLDWIPVFPAYEVAYGNGVFVAVGIAVLVSSDGQNWEAVPPPAPLLRRLSFVNGRFLAVERSGPGWSPSFTIWESTDGRTWTPYPFTPNPATPGPLELTRIVYKDGAYYIMALVDGYVTNQGTTRAGRLYTSSDLTNWTRVGDTGALNDLNSQFRPNDLAYGAGYFVAVGEDVGRGGAIFVSQDGQTWTRATRRGMRLESVAFGNGRFVAVGYVYGGGGVALASAPNDPTSWSGLTPPTSTSVSSINVTFDGTRFLSVPISSEGRIWAYDGTTANPNYASLPYRVGGGHIAYGNGRYVVMGAGFASSQDLVNWTTGFERNFPIAVTYGNGRFVFAVGDYSGFVLATAPEGPFPVWQVSDPTPRAGIHRLAYLNGRFIGVGQYGRVYLSQDGASWTQVNTPTSQYLSAVAYGNGTYVAVAYDGDIIYSQAQDASTWSLAQGAPSNGGFGGVAYGNGVFVAAGSVVYTSHDGVNWTAQTSPDPDRYIEDITFGNGYFVAVTSNKIYRSQDGVTWETITPPPSPLGPNVDRDLERVVWTGRFFVAVGRTFDGGVRQQAYVITSADGLNWTLQNTPFNIILTDVTVGNQYLVAVGRYGVAVARLP